MEFQFFGRIKTSPKTLWINSNFQVNKSIPTSIINPYPIYPFSKTVRTLKPFTLKPSIPQTPKPLSIQKPFIQSPNTIQSKPFKSFSYFLSTYLSKP